MKNSAQSKLDILFIFGLVITRKSGTNSINLHKFTKREILITIMWFQNADEENYIVYKLKSYMERFRKVRAPQSVLSIRFSSKQIVPKV